MERQLGPVAFKVWIRLLWKRPPCGITRATNRHLAEKLSLSLRQVRRATARLTQAGLLIPMGRLEDVMGGEDKLIHRKVLGDYREGKLSLPEETLQSVQAMATRGGRRAGAGRPKGGRKVSSTPTDRDSPIVSYVRLELCLNADQTPSAKPVYSNSDPVFGVAENIELFNQSGSNSYSKRAPKEGKLKDPILFSSKKRARRRFFVRAEEEADLATTRPSAQPGAASSTVSREAKVSSSEKAEDPAASSSVSGAGGAPGPVASSTSPSERDRTGLDMRGLGVAGPLVFGCVRPRPGNPGRGPRQLAAETREAELWSSVLPPFPSTKLIHAPVASSPPPLPEEDYQAVRFVLRTFRSAVQAVYGEKSWAFAGGDVRNSEHYPALLAGVKYMRERGWKPAPWIAFVINVWRGRGQKGVSPVNRKYDGKAPPPATLILQTSFMRRSTNWYEHESPGIGSLRTYIIEAHKDLVQRWQALDFELRRTIAVDEETDVAAMRAAVEKWFPGGWQKHYWAARTRAIEDGARLRRMAREGEWTW